MNHSLTNPIVRQLEFDLQQVNAHLLNSLDSLGGPLGELVRAQVQHSQPYFRAAGVFVTVYSTSQIHSQPAADNLNLLPTHIATLAAAVEMLYIALNVHKQLVQAAPHTLEKQASHQENLDRTFLGSTILAGDYCFSRAAQLATATENPQVVAHFAQALETLSEGLLRQVFHNPVSPDAPVPDINRTLILSGIESALLLAQPSPTVRTAILAYAASYADIVEYHMSGNDENRDHLNGQTDKRQSRNGQAGSTTLSTYSQASLESGPDTLTHLVECWTALDLWQAATYMR
jgi:hypothetical protein